MKYYQIKQITSNQKVFDKMVCDLCGTESEQSHWGESYCESDEIEVSVVVKRREGFNYPYGGHGTEIDLDICPKCFKEKLIPFLQEQGANIEEKDWDW